MCNHSLAAKAARAAAKAAGGGGADDSGPSVPNKILFCTNLPDEATPDMLRLFFQP